MFSGFKINKIKSIYNNKTVLNEYIPDNRLNSLIQTNHGVEFSEDHYQRDLCGFANELAIFNNYLSKYNKKENCFKIKLKNSPYDWGRIQAVDYATLAVFHRPTRHSLCHDKYVDIDITSCCQNIFLNLVKMNGLTAEYTRLDEYCVNRNALLKHYGEKYGVNRNCIKNLFTAIGFGGSYKSWFSKNNIEFDNDAFIMELNAEYYKLAELIYDANKNICDDILKAIPHKFIDYTEPSALLFKKKATTMAMVYQTAERYCQEAVISFLCQSKGFNLKDIVPCQDGFMILAPLMYSTICDDCEKVVKNLFKMDLQFLVKEFDERFDIPAYISDKDKQLALKQQQKEKKEAEIELKKQQKEAERQRKIEEKEQQQREIEATNQTIREEQQRIKEENVALLSQQEKDLAEERQKRLDEFEKDHLKIVNKSLYIKELPNGTNRLMSPKQLADAYNHLEGIKKMSSFGIIEKPFIPEWTEMNPSIRCKDDMEVVPPPLVCHDNVYNLWKPFDGETLFKKSGYIYSENAITKIRKHILILCKNDEAVAEYFELWIAQMIQFPAVKSNCPILISKEGAGKGTLLQILLKLLGVNKYYETTEPERDVWGSFNGLMGDAFLVNLNELSKKSTKDCMGKIKGLITDGAMTINPKGITPYKIISYHRFIITTNSEDPMPTKKDDRRFWIVRSSDELIGNKAYFDDIQKIIQDENAIASIFHYFNTLEGADNFKNVERPLTEYQQNIQEANISPPERWLRDYVSGCGEAEVELLGKQVFQLFQGWKEMNGITFEINSIKLGLALSNMNVDGIKKGRHTEKGATKIFDIKKIRKHFGIGCLIQLADNEESEEEE